MLKQYCEFMEILHMKEALLPSECTDEDKLNALEAAIRECIKKKILSDYLTRKATEVINMFLDGYDYKLDLEVQREEAREEGLEEGREPLCKWSLQRHNLKITKLTYNRIRRNS